MTHLLNDDLFTFIEGDVREPFDHLLPKDLPLGQIEGVYHLASRASPADFTDYAVEIATTNAEGARHALDFATEQRPRIVYASSSEVYGNPEIHPQPEEYNGSVNLQGPRAYYDEGKRYGEALSLAYKSKFDLDVRVARIFNTYGPRMKPDDGRVIPTFLRQALRGEALTVHGSGDQTRSFLYVRDQIEGLKALMRVPSLAGEAVNIGSPDERAIGELADLILRIARSEAGVTHEPRPADDPDRRRPDITKARRFLGWSPETSLKSGLKRTLDEFRTRLSRPPK